MKKLYLTAAAWMACSLAFAQQFQPCPDTPYTVMQQAPARAESEEDEVIRWGYYQGEDFANDPNVSAIGMGVAGPVKAGILVPAADLMKGATIKGVMLPINEASVITECRVYVYTKDFSEILSTTEVDVATLKTHKYNEVNLDVPVVLNEDLIVVYELVTEGYGQAVQFPMYFDKTLMTKGGMYVFNDGQWQDFGTQEYYGTLIMKVCLTDFQLEDYSLTFVPANGYSECGKNVIGEVTVKSNSNKAVENFTYTITVGNGEPEERQAMLKLDRGFDKQRKMILSFMAPEEPGNYDVKLKVTKVNGEANDEKAAATTLKYINLTKMYPRNVVMEENNGCGCGNGARGIAGLKKCTDALGDRFIGVSYHLYEDTDPMYITDHPYLGWTGAPSCFLDRSGQQLDSYYGSDNDILEDVKARTTVPPLVKVDAKAVFSEDYRKVTVSADVTAAAAGTYDLDFLILGNQLESPAFVQTNFYSYYSGVQAGIPKDDPLFTFMGGGELGYATCLPSYDDIALAASYANGRAKGGSITLKAGETGNVSYTLDIPQRENLFSAIAASLYNIDGVVLVLNADGSVANAGQAKAADMTGVGTVLEDREPEVTARYTTDGRKTGANAHGIVLERMADGSCRKVLMP